MQNIKNSLFLYLTPRQKSQLLGTLKAYFKKFDLNSENLAFKFLKDEEYYIKMNNPHFEFVEEYLEDDIFLKELKKFFDFCAYEKHQKELLEPYIDKQKEYEKQMRKKAQEFKMSKLKPTQKQLKYYEKITKAHNVEKKDMENASRLDLRNWIMEIIEKEEFSSDKER